MAATLRRLFRREDRKAITASTLPPMPRLLALDTATETLHLGLLVDGRALLRALPGGALASQALLPAIAALLAEAGLGVRQLDAIAFGRGPGAFTGLRTACSVAQGLAIGADRPLLALDTLAVLAEAARRQGAGTQVWATLDARMGEVYAAGWQAGAEAGEWTALPGAEPALLRPEAWAARWAAQPADIAGSGLGVLTEALPAAAQDWRRLPEVQPDGAALLALALAAHRRGAWIDPALALPLYLRDQVAMTTAERAAARAAATR